MSIAKIIINAAANDIKLPIYEKWNKGNIIVSIDINEADIIYDIYSLKYFLSIKAVKNIVIFKANDKYDTA